MKHFLVTGALGALAAVSATCTWADDGVEARAILGGTPFANANYGNNVVKGRASLASQEQGTGTKVTLKMQGLKPGTAHIGHIHGGNCPQLFVGTILHNLEPVVADASGEGTSRTDIPGSIQGLVDCSWWVAVHEGPENTAPQTPALAVGPVITRGKKD
jgi:hypothetical protein